MKGDPDAIGRYRVVKALGRGAMGVIYKAHDPEIDRPVAIKLISTDLLGGVERADYIRRFRREAQAAGRCNHPNIVSVYDFSTHDGDPYIVMEFVDGISLKQAIDSNARFELQEAGFLILQVLEALAGAHALGVVHRDIKPANILLAAGGRVKVADFGVSRIGNSDLTAISTIVGTPSYMAPEQCRAEEAGLRADLFSVGAVLFELLTGTRAFPGTAVHEVLHRILLTPVPPLPDPIAAAAPEMGGLLRRAMEKLPADRFSSAHEMASALRDVLRQSASTFLSQDGTLVAQHQAPPLSSFDHLPQPSQTNSGVDDEVLSSIERRLASYLGPIAKLLVRTAATKPGTTLEMLCETLAGNIAENDERWRFREEALSDIKARTEKGPGSSGPRTTGSASATAASPLPQAELDRAQAALTQHLGPIARVLVRRVAAASESADDLWHRLARHLEQDAEREAFLSRRSL